MGPRKRLRQALARGDLVVAPFCWDGLTARLAQQAGFPAAYMTGFGTAMARGLPDLGLLGLAEMVENVRTLAACVEIPLICDADTGYGGSLQVMQTVARYEAAGAAALHLEDQVWPKRCGFLEGKQVVPEAEMSGRVRAAVEARSDADLVIIARTDALEGSGWDEAERRARAYYAAGADLVFVDGILSRDDLETYARRLEDVPRLYNGQLAKPEQVEALGFHVMLHTAPLAVAYRSLREALGELRATGEVKAADDPQLLAELLALLGAPEALARARRYEPDD